MPTDEVRELRRQIHDLRNRMQVDAAVASVARSPALRGWVAKAWRYASMTAVEAKAIDVFLEMTREDER